MRGVWSVNGANPMPRMPVCFPDRFRMTLSEGNGAFRTVLSEWGLGNGPHGGFRMVVSELAPAPARARLRLKGERRAPMPTPYSLSELVTRLAPVLRRLGARHAVVFGSHARGQADRFSDVDVAVVAQSALPFVDRYRDFLAAFEVVPELQLLVYLPEEWEKITRGGTALERALMGGVPLWETSDRAVSAP